jgi:iron complex outermembrane receptor protein
VVFRCAVSIRAAHLVLVDGQPLQDANSTSVDWRTVMTDDIERVEVVHGAFSSLYGSSAIGVGINVLTKQPTKHEFTIRGKCSQKYGQSGHYCQLS